MPRTARQRAFLYAATAFATLSLLYGNSEHHVPVVQRAIRRYRRRYELEVMRGYSDTMINNLFQISAVIVVMLFFPHDLIFFP